MSLIDTLLSKVDPMGMDEETKQKVDEVIDFYCDKIAQRLIYHLEHRQKGDDKDAKKTT